MRKLEKRALLCLALVIALIGGLAYFTVKLEINGSTWASFYANQHVYSNGHLAVGSIYDRNGERLLKLTKSGQKYNGDAEIRRATLHAVGDPNGNISTGANIAFKDKLIGYNFLTGTGTGSASSKSSKSSDSNKGSKVVLTIDSEVNRKAYEALAGRNGLVGVYNYKTGEIICMVSSPTYDPGEDGSTQLDNPLSGTYLNKLISGKLTPGSTFKLVTTAAALENIEDIDTWSYQCTGRLEVGSDVVTCPSVHGTVDIYGALAKSCNCAYATLAMQLGGDVLAEYVDKLGLESSYDIDGISSAAGSFNFDTASVNVGWAGIGQYEDEVNPLSMMVYMGAIAGGGKAANPTLLGDSNILEKGIEKGTKLITGDDNVARNGTVSLLDEETADTLSDMMRNNVKITYGDDNYKGLSLHAKSGTAEVGTGKSPHSWFCGFSGDYAFIVCVENGGYGSSVAGPIAGTVLKYMKDAGYYE